MAREASLSGQDPGDEEDEDEDEDETSVESTTRQRDKEYSTALRKVKDGAVRVRDDKKHTYFDDPIEINHERERVAARAQRAAHARQNGMLAGMFSGAFVVVVLCAYAARLAVYPNRRGKYSKLRTDDDI